jgi:multidrug efflux system membrane fusion protein
MRHHFKRNLRLTSRLLIPLFICLGLVFTACSKKEQGPNPAMMTVPVTVGKVQQQDVPVQVRAVGTVESFSTVTIRPQVGGILQKAYFHEGEDVKKGEILFQIDPRNYQAELAQAEANLQRDIAQAKNAREQATRYQGLVQKDYVTKEQYDQMRANADATEASVEASRANVQNARLNLGYCTIRSPIDGRTGNLLVHEGNVVKANETAMIDINQVRPIYVRFSVPEKNLPDIRKFNASGQLKMQAADQQEQQTVSGTLSFIDNAVDRTTGTILLKGTFENTDVRLWPGEFVDVTLTLTSRPKAILVPTQAIETGQDGQFVFVVKQDLTAEQRPVVSGFAFQDQTVIEKGLTPGETVVTDGQLRLLPGSKVEIKKQI